MEMQITVREIAQLSQTEGLAPEKERFLVYYRAELVRTLQGMGFSNIEFTESAEDRQPDITATLGGRSLCICLPPVPASPMELQALSAEQCACCEQSYPQHDVFFAALLADTQEQRLYLLGPVEVRASGGWLNDDPEQAQFLPISRRSGIDRYTALFGGCAMFKLSRLLIPHVLEHGHLPRFSVQGLFADKEQGENGLYALMAAAPPTHFMLVAKEGDGLDFRRPFFFYSDRPHAELELTRCAEGAPVELLDKTGRLLCAESLEGTLYPDLLACGKHYKWTLSLVADRCRPMKREMSISSGPLLEQARRDYRRTHGSAPPENFSVRVSTEGIRSFYQEPQQSYAELCGRVLEAEEVEVDSRRAIRLSLLPIPGNDDVEVQVFVGEQAGLSEPPLPGDVVECAGFLYASPDAVVESAESWQDSGEVAALQETRELELNSMSAYEQFSGYSLAQGVVAAAFARAGYSLLSAPGAHTREEATFLVQSPEGHKLLLFTDTLLSGGEPHFSYTEEQRESILKRARSAHGEELTAHHCLVKLERDAASEAYAVELLIDPACPAVEPGYIISDATQCPLPGRMTEELACRITCNAICSQDWTEFARAAAEDMEYVSHVNGTRTLGKIEFIRYMAERKLLWEEQQGWPGMSMETGVVTYQGKTRPCYMLECYGHRIGVAIVTLRGGFIAAMETLPLEVNDTYVPDAAPDEPAAVFHPLRGKATPFLTRQSPLQRYATAYVQECMAHKTGFITPEPEQDDASRQSGVSFRLQRHKGARWLKLVRNGPTFCDLAFAHGGHIYAICAVETENHPDHGGDLQAIVANLPQRDKLLEMAARYNFIPCVFPAKRDYTPNPKTTWNLWDVRTLQPVYPEQVADSPPATPSDWEILLAAQSELAALAVHSGGRPLACHDVPGLQPHFWFIDARGRLSWVILRMHAQGAHTDAAPTEAELQVARLLPGTLGYVMDVEAWGNAAHSAPAHSGAPLYLKLSEPQRVEP